MSYSTSSISYDANGNAWLYAPPNVLPLSLAQITYGPQVTLNTDDPVPSTGIWEIVSGSLISPADGTVVRQVTIVAGP